MISWFARNSVAANLLMVAIILGGFLAINTMIRMEAFPPIDIDAISVSVPLRSASPEEVELGIAVRIEEAVKDIEGIDRIVSQSVEGSTRVQIEIDSGYDRRELLDTVKSRIDAINTFPAEAEKPAISLAERRFAVISVAVAGDYSETEIRQYAERIRDELLQLAEISLVDLNYARNYEISIEASEDKLREFDLTLADLAQAIRESSVDVSAGNLRTDGGDVLIRSKGQAYRRADFESIIAKTNADGTIVRVGDIAVVNDGFEEDSILSRFNGRNSVFLDVSRTGRQSALDIAAKVKEFVDDKQDSLPKGMYMSYWDDDSQVLKNRLGILAASAIQGGILVILLLALFLRPAIAFWVFLGIPISFLGALFVMGSFGISLNMMSAFGFIVVLGIVVDDAIVTGETSTGICTAAVAVSRPLLEEPERWRSPSRLEY